MIFKKLMLLASLILGMNVPEAQADHAIDTKINHVVFKAFDGKKITLSNLKPILKDLMPKVADAIKPKIDTEYKDLHEALKLLNLEESNLLVVREQLKNVVSHLPQKSQEYIKVKFPLLG